MTPFEIGSCILAAIAIAGALIADGRARGRNEQTATRLEKVERKLDDEGTRINELRVAVASTETNAHGIVTMMTAHMESDKAAFAAIAADIKTGFSELRAEIRDMRRSRREDANPGD